MDQFTLTTANALINSQPTPTISLYMPVVKQGMEMQQNPIRLNNLLKQIHRQLDTNPHTTHQLKQQLAAFETNSEDKDFWTHLSIGMVVFITETNTHVFRLPLDVPETATHNSHIYLKPLLPLLTTNGKFFILTLSQNDVKLYEATRTSIGKRFLLDTPRRLSQIIDADNLQSHLQSHSKTSTGGNQSTVFGGQSYGEESAKKDLQLFINQVENGISKILGDEQAPLVIAAVEYLASIYRQVNTYHHLVEPIIEGSPDQTTKDQLHHQAWEIVRPIFKLKEKVALDKYLQLAGTGKTSTNLAEIIPAAHDGRVESLFILRDHVSWGQYSPKTRKVVLHATKKPTSIDLADLATTQVLHNSGTVYSLKLEEMIATTAIAAVFRY